MLRIAQGISLAYMLLALVLVGMSFRPPPEAVTIEIVYGTEKEDWLQAATERFLATNPPVRGRPIAVELQGVGSRETVLRIAIEGDLRPTAISPASSIHTELLRDEWQTHYGENILLEGEDAPQPLVLDHGTEINCRDHQKAPIDIGHRQRLRRAIAAHTDAEEENGFPELAGILRPGSHLLLHEDFRYSIRDTSGTLRMIAATAKQSGTPTPATRNSALINQDWLSSTKTSSTR